MTDLQAFAALEGTVVNVNAAELRADVSHATSHGP